MKAACLLLCLAVHQSAAHIFRRQQQRMPDGQLIVQPLNYIGQQQPMPTRYFQQQPYPQRYAERKSSESQESQRSSEKQRYQPRKYDNEYQKDERDQYLKNNKHYESMQSQSASAEYQPRKQSTQYQKRSYNPQSESIEQQYEHKQLKQYKTTQKKYNTHDSTSTESREKRIQDSSSLSSSSSSSSSEEVKKTTQSRKDSMKPYGDAITWNGIKIAVSQKTPVTKKDIEDIFAAAQKTMSHVSEQDKQMFRQQLQQAEQTDNEDARLNATELLNKYQYPVEEHTIKTDDGYLLTLFRINKDSSETKPVVLMMHGLLGSADDWLLMGPNKALAYQLADAGYDVWLGNARGNKYSRKHVTKHPAQADFWQFGTDEIALQDLPAMIDYVLDISKQSKLVYVGHSLGTTAFFALAASRPEYNDKITKMYAMSPMAFMGNARSPLLRMIAPTSPLQSTLHHQLGHGEFKPSKELVKIVGGDMIEKEIGVKSVARNINFVMAGVNVEDLDANLIPVIMSHVPAGGSTRQVKQYGQAVASNEFTKYDFGAAINQRVYGSSMPPKYQLKNVRTPVVLFSSAEDWLADPRDVERLANELPNAKVSQVTEPHFGSMAFQLSSKAPQMVYRKLIDSIQNQAQQTLNYVY